MSGSMTDTLLVLYGLVRLDVISPITIAMYMYICTHNNQPIPNSDLTECAGATVRTLHRHARMLEKLELIEIERTAGKPNVYHRQEPTMLEWGWQLPSSSSKTILSLEDVVTGDLLTLCLELRRTYKTRNLEDVATPFAEDTDWKRIKAIMRKHFKLSEIERGNPTSKKMFTRIYSLTDDEDLDLESYAEWYARVKYPTKRFSWGMFLYESMIDEYKNSAEKEEQFRTSSPKRKKKHAANADKDKDFYESIPRRKKK